MCYKITEIDKNQENSCRATVLGSKCDEKNFCSITVQRWLVVCKIGFASDVLLSEVKNKK